MNLVNKEGCRFLRAKNAYGTMEGGDDPLLPLDEGTTTYWCVQSCSPVGPNNLPAFTGSCNQNRICFDPISDELRNENPIHIPDSSLKA